MRCSAVQNEQNRMSIIVQNKSPNIREECGATSVAPFFFAAINLAKALFCTCDTIAEVFFV